VGDALYFNIGGIVKYQLGALSLSVFKKPINCAGCLMTTEDGGLSFAAVEDATNLTLWSMENGPEGTMGWAKLRVIDLKILLPALSIRRRSFSRATLVSGFVEDTQIIFVSTYVGCYMVDLKSGRTRNVSYRYSKNILPYI
jgi:hypothetical protein